MVTIVKERVKARAVVDMERCKGCAYCVGVCPKESLSMSSAVNQRGHNFAEFDPKKGCTGCGVCALVCPDVAIEVYK